MFIQSIQSMLAVEFYELKSTHRQAAKVEKYCKNRPLLQLIVVSSFQIPQASGQIPIFAFP